MNLLISVILLFLSHATISCEFGNSSSCNEGFKCVFVNTNEDPSCVKEFGGPLPKLLFPYKQSVPVTCWKSEGRLDNSSHAWINALYAIDLHGPRNYLGKIHSGLSGRVVAFGECAGNTPMCNSAFGNQVKIFAKNGVMLYYVHLSEIYVKTGDQVKAGQVIGREGATGNVGEMWGQENDFHHLHLSVHHDWRNYSKEFHLNTWPGMNSIPFEFIMQDNQPRDMRDIRCSKFSNNPDILMGTIQ